MEEATHPEHRPQIGVSKTKGYIADVETFRLALEIGGLRHGGRCRRARRHRNERSTFDGSLRARLVSSLGSRCLLSASARGRRSRRSHRRLKHLRLFGDKRTLLSGLGSSYDPPCKSSRLVARHPFREGRSREIK